MIFELVSLLISNHSVTVLRQLQSKWRGYGRCHLCNLTIKEAGNGKQVAHFFCVPNQGVEVSAIYRAERTSWPLAATVTVRYWRVRRPVYLHSLS